MYESQRRSTSTTTTHTLNQQPQLTPAQLALQRKQAERIAIQRKKREWMNGFCPNAAVQRKTLEPVLKASTLKTEHQQAIQREQEASRQELSVTQANLPTSKVIQRMQAVQDQTNTETIQRTPDGRMLVPSMQAATQYFNEQISVQRKKDPDGGVPLASWQAAARTTTTALAGLYQRSKQPIAERQQDLALSLSDIEQDHDRQRLSRIVLSQIKPTYDAPVIQRMLDLAVQEREQRHSVLADLATVQRLQERLSDLEAEEQLSGPKLTERIQARRGQGFTLPKDVQRQLEQELNIDLSGVRIHADAEANKLAKSVSAVAFTTGKDIFFQANKYDPNSTEGFKLLAHEVTHVKQQMQGRASMGIDADAGLEAEAKQVESKVNLAKQPLTKPPRTAVKPAMQTAQLTGALQRQMMPTPATAASLGYDINLGGTGQKWKDAQSATVQAISQLPSRIAEQYKALPELLKQGIFQVLKDAAMTLGATTAIGATIGAFFGGVSAIPGARIGFEVGLTVLKLWGIYEIVKFITSQLGALGTQLQRFIKQINVAGGDPKKVKAAADTLTNAFLILTNGVITGVAAYTVKRGAPALANSKFGQTIAAKSEKSASVQWLLARHQGAVAREQRAVQMGQRKLNPQIKVVDDALKQARSHVAESNFIERSLQKANPPKGMNTNGLLTTKNVQISANQIVRLEPIPKDPKGFDISKVRVFDKTNKDLGGLKPISGIPNNSAYSFELKGKQGGMAKWRPSQAPPVGFRYQLVDNKMKDNGFSGGHTREAFDEAISTYSDKAAILNTDSIRFRFPGYHKAIDMSKIEYSWNGKQVKNPKTIFEGKGKAGVIAFERALAIELEKILRGMTQIPPNRNINVKMEVIGKSSKKEIIDISVYLDDASTLQNPIILTWYIKETAFNNRNLLR